MSKGVPVNRCPRCGGIADRICTELGITELFHCSNGMTHMTRTREGIIPGYIVPCGTEFGTGKGKRIIVK